MRRNTRLGFFGKSVHISGEDAVQKWQVYFDGSCEVKSTDGTDLTAERIKAALGAAAGFQMASSGQTLYINKDVNDPNRIAACKRYDAALAKLEEVKKTQNVVVRRSY